MHGPILTIHKAFIYVGLEAINITSLAVLKLLFDLEATGFFLIWRLDFSLIWRPLSNSEAFRLLLDLAGFDPAF